MVVLVLPYSFLNLNLFVIHHLIMLCSCFSSLYFTFVSFFFFFSSRRRHTRLTCDWSSDVCSSDLEECSLAPYTEPGRATDPLLNAPVDYIIEYRPCEPRFQPFSDENVGSRRRGCRIDVDPQRMRRVRRHKIADICAKNEFLMRAVAAAFQLDGQEGRVVHGDAAA